VDTEARNMDHMLKRSLLRSYLLKTWTARPREPRSVLSVAASAPPEHSRTRSS